MGHNTPQTGFTQWLASHSTFATAVAVCGDDELTRCLADTTPLGNTVVLSDVLATRSPFELLSGIDARLPEVCDIVIAEPTNPQDQSARKTAWTSRMLSMAQRFGFSEVDEAGLDTPDFECLRLRRTQRPPFRLGKITIANAAEMRELFSRIFGHQMNEAFWRWKYADGSNHGMGLWQDGQLVAHYGGLAEHIVLDGKQQRAMQMVDVMVDPKVRHAARRQSPFFILTSAFTECFVGWTQPYLLAFGFPSHRHLQLAEHLKLYAAVGEMTEVVFSSRDKSLLSDLTLKWQQTTAANFASVATALDLLWQQMRAAMPETTFVEKGAARIHRRYLAHPEIAYQVHLIRQRWSNKPLAVVVLKQQADKVLLMDIVGDPASFPRVIASVQRYAQRNDGKPLLAWITSSFTSSLASASDQVTALPISIPTITWTEGPPPEHLKNKWWLTAGDTDFL